MSKTVARDKLYLESIFPDLSKIEGIILKLTVETGYDSYVSKFGDPTKLNTLVMADTDNNVIVVFEKDSRSTVKHMAKDVVVLKSYKYDSDTIILKRVSPQKVPNKLDKYIFDFNPSELIKEFGNINIEEKLNEFLDKNYEKGDKGTMTSFKVMKEHPDWREEWRNHLDIKAVQMCRTCGQRALKGCCPAYRSTNRKTIFMVMGWTEKSYSSS